MTLKDNGQVILPLFKTVRSSSYTFLRKKTYFRTGHEKKEFVCFFKSTSFYERNKRRTVDY